MKTPNQTIKQAINYARATECNGEMQLCANFNGFRTIMEFCRTDK